MRLSEAITIYLATGAPFTVSYLLHNKVGEHGALKMLNAVAAGLFWPIVAVRALVTRYSNSASITIADSASRIHEEEIHEAKRQLLASIHVVIELTANAGRKFSGDLERAAFLLRENVETYVGLAPVVDESVINGSPTEHAGELFRIAGRKGDDLRLAMQCAHRRNIARIVEHHARARVLLVHAVADVREALDHMRPQLVSNGMSERRLRLAALELYTKAFDLLSLMGDEEASMRIAELLNRELSRIRRLEIMEPQKVLTEETGGGLCTEQTSRPYRAPLSSESTLARG